MKIVCLGLLLVLAVSSALPVEEAIENPGENLDVMVERWGWSCGIGCKKSRRGDISCGIGCGRRKRDADLEEPETTDAKQFTNEDLLKAFDTDNNGAIDVSEWTDKKKHKGDRLADFWQLLELVDSNDDEMVSLEELKTLPTPKIKLTKTGENEAIAQQTGDAPPPPE